MIETKAFQLPCAFWDLRSNRPRYRLTVEALQASLNESFSSKQVIHDMPKISNRLDIRRRSGRYRLTSFKVVQAIFVSPKVEIFGLSAAKRGAS